MFHYIHGFLECINNNFLCSLKTSKTSKYVARSCAQNSRSRCKCIRPFLDSNRNTDYTLHTYVHTQTHSYIDEGSLGQSLEIYYMEQVLMQLVFKVRSIIIYTL